MKKYLVELSQVAGAAWNRFWFTPSDVFPLAVLRVLTGLAALYFVLSHTADLIRWFGPNGLLPIATMQSLMGGQDSGQTTFRYSHLLLTDDPALLWLGHGVACVVIAAFTIGLWTRITNVLALAAVLTYVHRAPLITGTWEPVLTMVLLYLCLTPCGAALSVDRWRAARIGRKTLEKSVWANLGLRLIQVHLTGLYLMMGLSKLAGEVWWTGEAAWWLIARTDTRVVDLSFLHQAPYLVNLWTHAIVAFELAFPLLIWNRLLRPLLLAVAVVMWTLTGLLTGLFAFAAIMLIANLAFASPDWLRVCATGFCRRCCPGAVRSVNSPKPPREAVAA